ncbi:MAG: discoidin domain-containing protein, partial [Planctomycetes bacterium]|nr:discoidin domain-containing protein [Planctomycetota bacterium]
MMDVPGISMGDPIVDVTPTADGTLYTPSFAGFSPSRPWHLDQFDGTEWTPELIMGVNDDGTRADPAIIINAATGARVGSFFQVAGALVDEKSAVISEWINNWYLLNVSPAGPARDPKPAGGDVDILRDGALTWTPGPYPGTHNVYFGESYEDVNGATDPTASGLTTPTFDPGRLEFGQTYYWRVDEVNASADKTVYAGKVWDFEVEPYAIQIPAADITATASSVANEFSTAEVTIDGAGLGPDNTHGISSETMWFTEAVDLDPWIQYEFDVVKQLDTMRVWNSNSAAEIAIGWGAKDVEVSYSADGENWDVLAGVTQFNRAPGSPAYNQYDVIAFGGVAAKFVRINIASNWGGILMSYSLSEVQFDVIPAQARTPDPADGATGVLPNAVVSWRAGREAGQHTIYVS